MVHPEVWQNPDGSEPIDFGALAAKVVRSDQFARTLAERIACATLSQTPGGDLAGYLTDHIVPPLAAIGFDCRIFDGNDALPAERPILIARRIEDAGLPTILFYGHGDVTPGCEGEWATGLDPWRLTEQDGKLWGRGVADNKGQHSVTIAALEMIHTLRGRLGFNAIFLMEMSEEVGSPGLEGFCRDHSDLLQADLLIASDGPRWRDERPTLFLGARGLERVELSLSLRDGAWHSGNWGGLLANPGTILTNALATIVDGQGRILVPALQTPDSATAMDPHFNTLELIPDPSDPAIAHDWGDAATPVQRVLNRNQFEVLALDFGDPAQPVYAIQPKARAICILTHIEGTDVSDLKGVLHAHLAAAGFPEVAVAHGPLSMPATRLSPDDPVVQWVANRVRAIAGTPVDILPNFGGALPNWVFRDTLGMRTVWLPHSGRRSNQHAANENVPISCLEQGLAVTVGLLWAVAETPDAIRKETS